MLQKPLTVTIILETVTNVIIDNIEEIPIKQH